MNSPINQLESQLAAASGARQKIDALNALAWELSYYDPQRALNLSEAAQALAGQDEFETQPYQQGLAESLRNLGHCYDRLGNPQLALSFSSQALARFETLDDLLGQATVLYVIGCIDWGLGDYAGTLEAELKALRICEALGEKTFAAKALNVMGLVYQSLGDLPQALAHFHKSWQIYQEIGDKHGQADVLCNRSEVYLLLGDYPQALSDGRQSLALHQEIGYQRDLGIVLSTLGLVYLTLKDYTQALTYFQQSLNLAQETGNPFAESLAWLNLAKTYYWQQDFNTALSCLYQALSIAQASGARPELYQAHQLLAEIYEQQGDFKQALEHYRQFHTVKEQVFNEAADQKLKSLQVLHETETARKEVEIHQFKNLELQQEIAERKRLEEQLHFQKTLLECQSETSIDGILVVSPTREWLLFNQRFVEMWELPAEVVKTRSSQAALQAVLDKVTDPQEFVAKITYLYEHPDEVSRDEISLKDGRTLERYSGPVKSKEGVYYGRGWYYHNITGRKRAEQALQESEERFHCLSNATFEGIALSEQGKIIDANEQLAQMLGYKPAEIIGQEVMEFVAPESRDLVLHNISLGVEGPYEHLALRKDGSAFPVEVRARAIPYQGRRVRVAAIRDITARKQVEGQIRQRTAQLEALRQVGLELAAQLDLDDLLHSILTRAIELLDGNSGGLYLYRSEREVLELVVALGAMVGPLGTVLQWGEGLSGQVWASGKPVWLDNYQQWSRRAATFNGYAFTTIVGVPIIWGEEFLGVLNVSNRPLPYTSADAELLGMFATQAAAAIHNARLVSSLRASEAKYRSVVNNVKEVIFQTDAAGLWTYLNPAWTEITGFSLSESLGTNFINYIHPDDRQRNWELFRPLIERQKDYCRHEIRYLTRDGGFRWIEVFARLTLAADDTVLGTSGTLNDITARKQMEEALSRRAVELSTLLEASRAISSTLDLNEMLLLLARQMGRAIGVSGCILSRWDREADAVVTWLEWRQTEAIKTDEPGTRYALNDYPLTRKVLETGRPVVVVTTDPGADPAEVAYLHHRQTVSLLMLPLSVGPQVFGLVELDDANERIFSATDLDLCQALTEQAAVAIQQARLYQQTRQDAETKAMLLQEINHRVKNNMAAIVGLLHIEQRHLGMENQAGYQAIMADLVNRIQGLATVHNLLSASEWSPLPLSKLTSQIIYSALQALPSDRQVLINVSPAPVQVIPKQVNHLGLVINELATNTLKYATPERDITQITVGITLKAGEVTIEFRDNGPGYPAEVLAQERRNVGIYLIQSLVQKGLRGQVSLHNDHGAVTTIRFKALAEG